MEKENRQAVVELQAGYMWVIIECFRSLKMNHRKASHTSKGEESQSSALTLHWSDQECNKP